MEIIDFMASEISFENINWRRMDGQTLDVFIYYKLTLFEETLFECSILVTNCMQGLH